MRGLHGAEMCRLSRDGVKRTSEVDDWSLLYMQKRGECKCLIRATCVQVIDTHILTGELANALLLNWIH